eukprot:SAG11_NODE_37431_length_257_cov_0.537975_1_plen_56_part_01
MLAICQRLSRVLLPTAPQSFVGSSVVIVSFVVFMFSSHHRVVLLLTHSPRPRPLAS